LAQFLTMMHHRSSGLPDHSLLKIPMPVEATATSSVPVVGRRFTAPVGCR
jgi:hypothetical protein